MRFEELNERRQRREVTMVEAGEMFGVMERTFRRWRDRYEAKGVAGLHDRRLSRVSVRAVPLDEALRRVPLVDYQVPGSPDTSAETSDPAPHSGAPLNAGNPRAIVVNPGFLVLWRGEGFVCPRLEKDPICTRDPAARRNTHAHLIILRIATRLSWRLSVECMGQLRMMDVEGEPYAINGAIAVGTIHTEWFQVSIR